MLVMTPQGLYCPIGRFYIDPNRAVDRAVITHAHADHARRGSRHYYCVHSGESLLRTRIGNNISLDTHPYGQPFYIDDVRVSFHPAGHILGSSQVRIEYGGEVWVASGDYKRDYDPTCEPFEVVECDVFVTEATFGTPGFTWNKSADVGREIFDWWQSNAEKDFNSVLFAYSLGKAQRVLGLLFAHAEQPIHCHPAATPLNECYRSQGVNLADTICLSKADFDQPLKGALILAPQSFLKSEQARILGGRYRTAFASGWTARGMHHFDKGFVLSDHADWNDLILTIQQTKAKTVYVQHRGHGSLVRHLKSMGINAFPESALVAKEPDQMILI
jgi:putative mRNA 3-end processing factor